MIIYQLTDDKISSEGVYSGRFHIPNHWESLYLPRDLRPGGMGIVHRATDRLTGEDVALKHMTVSTEELAFNTANLY